MTQWLERRQIPIYLGALLFGAIVGLSAPSASSVFEACIQPLLGALLYATFLQVPFTKLADAFRDRRFLTAVLVLNFVAVPLVVAALTAVVSLPQAVLLGVLLTLLTPCIDYVIVFSGLAGGDSHRLLAASPLVMLAQMVALPPLLWLFMGRELADVIEVRPFVEAFVFLIVVPLALAWVTQWTAVRHRAGAAVTAGMTAAMVPLMAATLLAVVAGEVPKIRDELGQVAAVVPVFAAFLVAMTGIGFAASRLFRLDTGRSRALIFSGVTRNSLVVLPLALALPSTYAVTPVVVVTQTLVELVGMVVLVQLVPRMYITV